MKVEKLEWDSAFFQMNIGKVEAADDLFEVFECDADFDLVYFMVPPSNSQVCNQLLTAGAVLADEKVTYLKKVHVIFDKCEQIYSYNRKNPQTDDAVIRIGIQSGVYSRFKTDLRFPEGSFERLYATWINKSIDRQIANEVFVFEMNNLLSGVITLREVNNRADIGILAVDEIARGHAIGRRLVEQAESYCVEHGYTELQVVTQKANRQACQFYERCGFTLDSTINIYHLWNKK